MTTDTDKLAEIARASGFGVSRYSSGEIYANDSDGIDITDKLAAFRAAILADLCGDLEPVAYSVTCDGHHAGNVFATMEDAAKAMHRLDKRHPNNVRMVVPLVNVATVAALKAENLRLAGEIVSRNRAALEGRQASEVLSQTLDRYEALEAERDALKARAAELEKDAARYRWLRQEHCRLDPLCHLSWKAGGDRNSSEWVNTATLESAIDAAIKKG